MPLKVLYESPVGFALFEVLDEGKVKDVSDVESLFSDPSQLSGVLQLVKFKKFTDQVEATQAAVSLTEGKQQTQRTLQKNSSIRKVLIVKFKKSIPRGFKFSIFFLFLTKI